MTPAPRRCAIQGCPEDLSRARYDCTCGCGKSWCAEHGARRKLKEMPGQRSFLVHVATPPLEPR